MGGGHGDRFRHLALHVPAIACFGRVAASFVARTIRAPALIFSASRASRERAQWRRERKRVNVAAAASWRAKEMDISRRRK